MLIRIDSNVSDDIYSDDFELQPGPRDPSVLYMQAEHRSTHVWNAGGGDSQRTRVRCRFPALHEKMVPILKKLRFDGVARLAGITIDWSLITALVERWRPETHTFHLPTGECTITLQDVSVLLGLRIDGNAVTGSTHVEGGWRDVIQNMFGTAPDMKSTALVGGRLKMSWLDSVTKKALPDDAKDDELLLYTRAYLLQLLGGVLFTDHQGSQVHCMFIPLLQNLSHCETLSWGSGVLAYLYRELCKSCKIGVEEMAGCVLLIQLWAWTRLPTLAPVPSPPPLDAIWGNLAGPYALRWCGPKSFADVSSHVACVHRLSLDFLVSGHFTWVPYTDDVLETLDEHCREGSDIWCYIGPLICFHIVEQHQPDRCLRQFGTVQDIPSPAVSYSKELHNMTLKGKWDADWGKKHQEHIFYWDNRLQHVLVVDNVSVGVTHGYDRWYGDITRPYHTRIAAAGSYVMNVLDQISLIAKGEVVGGDNSLIDSLATHGRRVLQYQYSRGLFQDFPVADRRVREETLRAKPKKVGHKGGRGGVNAPKRRKMDIDTEGADHVDEENIHLWDDDHEFQMDIDTGGADHADIEVPNIDLSAPSSHPTSELLPSRDFELPPVQQHHHTTIVEPSPAHYIPSFRLFPSNDFLNPPVQTEHVQQQQQASGEAVHDHQHPFEEPGQQQHHDTSIVKPSPANFVPSFELLSSNEFLTPHPQHVQLQQAPEEEVHDQQQTFEEPGQQPQSPLEVVQEQPPVEETVEEQHEAAHKVHHMKLRTQIGHPPKCGTDGIKKVPEVKKKVLVVKKKVPEIKNHYIRLRKKYP